MRAHILQLACKMECSAIVLSPMEMISFTETGCCEKGLLCFKIVTLLEVMIQAPQLN